MSLVADKLVTKNQHYVPKFYLERFINDDSKLEILDCEKRTIARQRAPKSVCKADFFYGLNDTYDDVSQALEDEFQKLESSIANDYDAIAKRFTDFSEITRDDKLIIATFMAMLWLRGPYMRKQTKKMDEEMIKMMTKVRFGSETIRHQLDKLTHENGYKISDKEKE